MQRFKLDPKKPKPGKTDWARIDSMSDEQVEAAAREDPDALPLTATQLARMTPVPNIDEILARLDTTAKNFSWCFGIPLLTIRRWQKKETLPTPGELAFLRLISSDPDLFDTIALGLKMIEKRGPPVQRQPAYHVAPKDHGWVVRRAGAVQVSSVHDTQKDAIVAAKGLARKAKRDLILHGRDGRIIRRYSYRRSTENVA